jgi:hypothetical protein
MPITTSRTSEPGLPDPCQGFITHLVLRCGRGDEAALGELFDLTFFVVAAAVRRGGLSSPEVDDEVIEAFSRIWGRSATYEPGENEVLAWLLDQAYDAPASARSGEPLSAIVAV